MRKYNRRYIHRLTRSDTARALLPNPLTRVELPRSAPPATVPPPSTRATDTALYNATPPGTGSVPAR